jgi:integrase
LEEIRTACQRYLIDDPRPQLAAHLIDAHRHPAGAEVVMDDLDPDRQTILVRYRDQHRVWAVRAFLTQVRAFESATEVPPNIFRAGRGRRRPYLFSDDDLCPLLRAPHQLRLFDALRPLTLVAPMGLLASAGLRIGEALRLTLDDAKLEADPPHLLILDTKCGKSRVVVGGKDVVPCVGLLNTTAFVELTIATDARRC